MFGKKQTASEMKKKAKTASVSDAAVSLDPVPEKVEAKPAPEKVVEKAPVVDAPTPVSTPEENPAAMLAGLNDALDEKSVDEKPKPQGVKKKVKDAPKEVAKGGDDEDPFAEEFEEGAGESQSDSITTLRLQRSRNRIWLDLRDGIDLKANNIQTTGLHRHHIDKR